MVILFSLLFIILISLQSSHSQVSSNHDSTYASRDTALVGYSNHFCDRLSIEGSGFSAEKVRITLSLLKNEPQTTKEELIKFAKTIPLNGNYKYWMFHLLPNSKITLTACIVSGMAATFVLVKGVDNFERWEDEGYDHYMEKIKVTTYCKSNDNNNKQHFYDYRVTHDDHYYLIYESENSPATLKLTFSITQVQYVVSMDIIADHCSISLNSKETCSLSVGLSTYNKALLQLEPQGGAEIDWESNNLVKVSCHTSVWVYVVICLSLAAGIPLLVLGVACICFFFICCFSKFNLIPTTPHFTAEKENGSSKPHSAEPSAPMADNIPWVKSSNEVDDSRPPPYNYNHYTSPPPYQP